ncbi:hypothetical protein N2152v2_007287 [Parachlorella kessleri]
MGKGGLALAAQLNATVITSAAWSRGSFSGRAVYSGQPLATLLDVPRWKESGGHSANTSSCVRVDLHDYRGYHHSKGGFGPLLHPSYDVRGAAALIAGHISRAVQTRLQANPDEQLCMVVDLGNPNFASNLTESTSYIQPVAQGWFFAPAVVKTAESILGKLAELGHSAFFGDPLALYTQRMRDANFSRTSAVYVASGIFGYRSGQGFHSEQLALVDLPVLSQATAFVGDSRSTLSVFAREYRAALGRPRSTYFPVSPGQLDFLSFAPK